MGRDLFLNPDEIFQEMELSEREMFRQIVRFEKLVGPDAVKDKDVLEIGSGNGIFSALMCLAGARSVTAMEPAAAGSSSGILDAFRRKKNQLGLKNCLLITDTLQQSELQPDTYDLIVAVASINHWDEQACIQLKSDNTAQGKYILLFKKCFESLRQGGKIIVSDVGRENFWGTIKKLTGLKHPFAPTVEWHKHQQPKLWGNLLKKAGFENIMWDWICPPPLKFGIDKFINNFIFAYFTASYFVLKAHK